MDSATSLASGTDDMTDLIILAIVRTAPFLGGKSVLLEIKKLPSALPLDFVSERYEASMWPARTISLAWYVMMAYGWVAS